MPYLRQHALKLFILGLTLCVGFLSASEAAIVKWKFDLGPPVNSSPNAIQEGYAYVTIDTENVRVIIDQEFIKIKHWWVSDYVIVMDGEVFLPAAEILPTGLPLSVVGQRWSDDDADPDFPYNSLAFDFELQDGAFFTDGLSSFLGNGDTPIFTDSVFELATPLGNLSGMQFWTNTVRIQRADNTSLVGRIESWMVVPEPATLTLMVFGLAGVGFARKKKLA